MFKKVYLLKWCVCVCVKIQSFKKLYLIKHWEIRFAEIPTCVKIGKHILLKTNLKTNYYINTHTHTRTHSYLRGWLEQYPCLMADWASQEYRYNQRLSLSV